MKRWQDFNRREQVLILTGALLLAVYFLWFTIVQPMQRMVFAQQSRNDTIAAELMAVKQMAAEILALQKNATGAGAERDGLARLVEKTLRQNQLRMSGYQPGSEGQVSLRFEQVALDGLMQWLYDLEVVHHVVIEELTIRPAPANGQVAASLRLRAPL